MKKLSVYIGIAIGLSLSSNPTQAQFFKKILNTVKNTADNRVNDQAAQSTNKAIDKTLDATKSNSNTSPNTNTSSFNSDNSSSNRVFGAFAKAAQQNPNDTSAADLTMKGLGILVGGDGVSAADSAEAIKSFMNSTGGTGFYYEDTYTAVTERGTVKSIKKTWFTASGEGRTETNLAAMMGIPGGTSIIGISHAEQPKYSILLDDQDKTYSLNIIDSSVINSGQDKYNAIKIGNETIAGYPCVHAKLTSTGRDKVDMDIWTSKNVPGYSIMEKMMASSKSMITPDMFKVLKQAGADGYFVKMAIKSKDISSEMLLTKVEPKNLSASLFVIPAGYTASKDNDVLGNLMKNAQNQK